MTTPDAISRRRFLGAAGMVFAADVSASRLLNGAEAAAPASFGPLKRVTAGLLDVSYAEAGPPDGQPVLLLHGWPYDLHSFVEAAARLAPKGYRVIVPSLRGYGETRFVSPDTMRNGQQSVIATDALALMDALHIPTAIVGGFDWGARTAAIMAALWPERCLGLVSVSGYLVGNPATGNTPLPPAVELQWWYQYYFATERGRAGYQAYRREFARLIWRLASPRWAFDDITFSRSAAAFDNPDHVAIVIHNYRWRLGLAQGESQYDELERRLAAAPIITTPQSRSKATRTVRRTPTPPPTGSSSQGSTNTATSRAVSATTSRRRLPTRLPKPSST